MLKLLNQYKYLVFCSLYDNILNFVERRLTFLEQPVGLRGIRMMVTRRVVSALV